MGTLNFPAMMLGTLAFFLVGAVWYGVLFGKAWQREVGISDPPRGSAIVRTMLLTLLLELCVAWTLAHLFARTDPSDRAIMMISTGFGAFVMSPAIGINYVHQRKSLKLFAIDAGHFIVGMAAMGAVFAAMN